MPRTIKYDSRGIAHIYQRGFNMSVLFYSVKDILVFYTILYTKNNKYNVTVLGVVCMYNHYHLTVTAGSHEDIADFQREFESTYAREFNNEVGIKGRVFEPVYGLSKRESIPFPFRGGSTSKEKPVVWVVSAVYSIAFFDSTLQK